MSSATASEPAAGRRLRILNVVPSLARNTGGIASYLIQAGRAVAPYADYTIFSTDAGQPAASKWTKRATLEDLPEGADEVDVQLFPVERPRQWAYSRELRRALRASMSTYDVVAIHSLNLFPQFAAYREAKRAGVPYVVTPHGALDPWLRGKRTGRKAVNDRLWQNAMFASATALHFTARREAEIAAGPVAGRPHWYVPNGIPFERFQSLPSGTAFRRRILGGDGDGALVLFFGRVAAKKGIDLLIRAFARLGDGGAHLAVVGPDDEGLTGELKELSRSAGVGDRVHFTGPLYGADQLAALAAADVWALTSYTENFGIAVLEAMAAGVPVVVSDAVNIAPDIAAADSGVVVPLEEEVVARRLGELVESPALRAELAERGRAFARSYDWNDVAEQLVSMYETVVGDRGDRLR
jgi:glycosyltransferase involved in cell wall biosynthesis